MMKNRTRSGRGNAIREAERDLVNLKDEAINDEVADLAVKLHGTLSCVTSKHSKEAVRDLIPDLISILNRLDAALKVNEDLRQSLIEMSKENSTLAKALETEKNSRRQVLEESLSCEEKADEEIKLLKLEIKNLMKAQCLLREDIEAKDLILKLLTADCEELSKKLSQNNSTGNLNERQFSTPKSTFKQSNCVVSPVFVTHNRYSALADRNSPQCSGKTLVVKAQIHEPPLIVPPKPTFMQPKPPSPSSESHRKKRRVVVLADSQGKEFHRHLGGLKKNFDVFVFSAPGAKMKRVIQSGLAFTKNLTEDDYILLLAGSNDVEVNEPYQLTVTQGLDLLLPLSHCTNIIVSSIPFRHDNLTLDNRVFYANHLISSKIRGYKGSCKLCFLDVNHILQRTDFTKHGLHFNRRGKATLGRHLSELIRLQKHESPKAQTFPETFGKSATTVDRRPEPAARQMNAACDDDAIEYYHSLESHAHAADAADLPLSVSTIFEELMPGSAALDCADSSCVSVESSQPCGELPQVDGMQCHVSVPSLIDFPSLRCSLNALNSRNFLAEFSQSNSQT